jgi:hypothetical protein
MNISKSCKLFLRDVYLYDIGACHYTIMQNLGFDLSKIDKNNKEKRNTQIGLMMRDNPKLTTILRGTTNSLIDEYLLRNEISEDDLIIRQYDGIISKKALRETTDQYIPLELRSIYQVMIISFNRSMYIATDGNTPTIKGVAHRYDAIDEVYKDIVSINYTNKEAIFKSLQNIKNKILSSEDPSLYCIPVSEDKYAVFFKQYGQLEISKTMARIMDTDDIDKKHYFSYYIEPFTKSITMEFV